MNDKNQKCPLCGYFNVYVGITSVECGYNNSCPNWTEQQKKIVEKLLDKQNASAREFSNNFDVDWEDNTDELFSVFDNDDDFYD